MKPEEALEILEEIKELDDSIYQYNQEYMYALDLAIIAIKKIQELQCYIQQIKHILKCARIVETNLNVHIIIVYFADRISDIRIIEQI